MATAAQRPELPEDLRESRDRRREPPLPLEKADAVFPWAGHPDAQIRNVEEQTMYPVRLFRCCCVFVVCSVFEIRTDLCGSHGEARDGGTDLRGGHDET